jgi:hypothetical protein
MVASSSALVFYKRFYNPEGPRSAQLTELRE